MHHEVKPHTHSHPFNDPFSGTTWVSQYQKGKTNLDFIEARDSEWQWHQLGHMQSASMQVCISLQTDNHASTPPLKFFTGWMPFLPPNQQCQSTEGQHEVKPVVRNFIQHSQRLICRGYLGGAMRWPSPSAISNNNPVSVPCSTVQYNHL